MSVITDLDFMRGFIRLTANAFQNGWHERNGGNLSYRMTSADVSGAEPFLAAPSTEKEIGLTVDNLAGEHFLFTGSGKYMQNVGIDPEDALAIIRVSEDGKRYTLRWGLKNGGRPTSELPTHLLNHSIRKRVSAGKNRVIYHAHPANLIALTFVLPLTDAAFTQELWEMMTECPVVFPDGVGVVPWMVPGGVEIGIETGKKMETYTAVAWAHHGLFCAGNDFDEAFGLMETVEKAAEIAVKVRAMGGKKQTITAENFRDLAKAFGITLREGSGE